MKRLDIAEVVHRSGFSTSTLRYYETRGLIESDGRHGLRRQYDDSVLSRLALIALGQRCGFSLNDIANLFLPKEVTLGLDRDVLRDKAAALQTQVQELQATAALLEHIAACTAPSHLECPKFQSLLQDTVGHS